MSKSQFDKQKCIDLLTDKQQKLRLGGQARLPAQKDFAPDEIVAIKAFLGPWPRALEAAALKPKPEKDRAAINRERRIRAKRARNTARNAARDAARNTARDAARNTARDAAKGDEKEENAPVKPQ